MTQAWSDSGPNEPDVRERVAKIANAISASRWRAAPDRRAHALEAMVARHRNGMCADRSSVYARDGRRRGRMSRPPGGATQSGPLWGYPRLSVASSSQTPGSFGGRSESGAPAATLGVSWSPRFGFAAPDHPPASQLWCGWRRECLHFGLVLVTTGMIVTPSNLSRRFSQTGRFAVHAGGGLATLVRACTGPGHRASGSLRRSSDDRRDAVAES